MHNLDITDKFVCNFCIKCSVGFKNNGFPFSEKKNGFLEYMNFAFVWKAI